MIELFFSILRTIFEHPYSASFVAGFIAEEGLLILSLFSGQYVIPFYVPQNIDAHFQVQIHYMLPLYIYAILNCISI